MQRLAGVFSMLHGRKEETEMKAETTIEQKPAREKLFDLVGRFKLSVADRLVVKPEDEPSVDFLERLGLVKTEVEYSPNLRTGVVEQRKMARWVSWRCEDCVNFFVGDMKTKPSLVADEVTLKNIRQCKRGFSLQFTDTRKGKRCAFFEDKRLKGALE